MEDKKVFSINPDLFTFKTNTTRRKKPKGKSDEKIKVKEQVKNKMKNESLNKKSILKMIRDHHSEKNKEQFSNYEKNLKPTNTGGDFEKARNFFNNMKVVPEIKHNQTLKSQSSQQPVNNVGTNIQLNEPIQLKIENSLENNASMRLNTSSVSVPKYGCLKNGSLPTYRNYMNNTRKNDDPTTFTPTPRDMFSMKPTDFSMNKPSELLPLKPAEMASIYHQKEEKLKNLKKKKRRYQKKTIKRTYKIGKSRVKPYITVLVSNKTMRNKITEKKQMLNQVPLHEIRRYLIKHGFIKVGTTTPNDVLRQMYSSAMMICGEVQNHNQETLMYNFLYNKED
jgi:hypothetical protein